MSDPKISVILPVFNGEEHLREALESVLNQTEPSLEVIVIDDGSTDGTPCLLRQLAEIDSRLVLLRQENTGVYRARNHALEHARGEWIAFLDADDWLRPQTYETWLKQAEDEDCDLLIGNGFPFASKPADQVGRKPLLQQQPTGQILRGTDWIVHCVGVKEWPHYIWLQMVRRSLVEKNAIRFLPGYAHLDIVWTTQVALAAERVAFCDEPNCGYRRNPGSISRCPSEPASIRRAESYLIVLDQLIALAGKTSDRRLRKALLRHCNREAGHFFGVLRKRIQTRDSRVELARKFLRVKNVRAIALGAATARERWRAFRIWMVVTKIRLFP